MIPLRATAANVALVLIAAATACSSSSPAGPAATSAPVSGSEVGQIAVQNCGRTVTVAAPARRIVSGWTTSTELLVELGLQDEIVGQYNVSAGTPSSQYADALSEIPVLNSEGLTREQLLAAGPDLVWADGEYLFDGTTLPTIDDLAESGTAVVVLSGFCGDDATAATVEDVFTDLDTIGTLVDDREVTDGIARQLRGRLDDVEARVADAPAAPLMFLSVYDGRLLTFDGVYTDIARLAGGENVYAGGLPDGQYYGEVSREDVIARDPTTIVLLTGPDQDAAAATASLGELLPSVSAVRDGAVITMPESDSTNLRAIDGVEALSAALHR